MAKGPKELKTTSTTTIDPALKARQDQLWQQAQGLPTTFTPYSGQRFEGFNPDQQQSFELARQAATAGAPGMQQAMDMTGLLGGYEPQMSAPTPSTSFTADGPGAINSQQIAPGLLGGPVTTSGVGATNVNARRFTDSDINQYMNPFIGNVVDASLGDIERARQEAVSNARAGKIANGAFGGARHGVSDAITNREYGNIAASTSANLRKAGFDTAAGLISSDDNRDLSAQQGNQQSSLQASMANAANTLSANTSTRDLLSRILMANQGADLTAQQTNAANTLSTNQFNAGARQQNSQFNSAQDLQSQGMNQQADLAGAGLRLNAAGQLGTLSGQYQGLLGQGADLLNRVGGQQQQLGQAQRDFDYDQWSQGQAYPAQRLQFLQSLLSGQQYGSTNTQTAPNPNRGGVLNTIAGLGMTALGGPAGGLIGGLLGGGGVSPMSSGLLAATDPAGIANAARGVMV